MSGLAGPASLPGAVRRVLLSLAAAAALAGCGSDESDGRLLTDREAERLLTYVDRVDTAAADNRCDEARDAADDGQRRALALSRRVHRELKQNLIDWFEHLESAARSDCARPEKTPTPDETQEPTPTPTEEATPDPTPTPTPSATPTATPDPSVTPDPGSGVGGTGAPEDAGGGEG